MKDKEEIQLFDYVSNNINPEFIGMVRAIYNENEIQYLDVDIGGHILYKTNTEKWTKLNNE